MSESFDDPRVVKFPKDKFDFTGVEIELLKKDFKERIFDKVVKFVKVTPVKLP